MVTHSRGGEGGIQVPAWVKLCIHPVPFFPDVVLRVCNIAVNCVALSMFLQRTVGEFICPYPRSWQKYHGYGKSWKQTGSGSTSVVPSVARHWSSGLFSDACLSYETSLLVCNSPSFKLSGISTLSLFHTPDDRSIFSCLTQAALCISAASQDILLLALVLCNSACCPPPGRFLYKPASSQLSTPISAISACGTFHAFLVPVSI